MPDANKLTDQLPRGPDEIRRFVMRAQAGDESTLPVLRQMLESDSFMDLAGNLATKFEDTVIGNAAGKDLLFKEAIARKLSQIRKEMAGENPTPLERLLADRIALCWLSLHDAEIRFAQAKDLTMKQAAFWQERIDRAHRRYLTAIKTLATIRKLALPVVQVNIAKRQTNIAGATPIVQAEKETP